MLGREEAAAAAGLKPAERSGHQLLLQYRCVAAAMHADDGNSCLLCMMCYVRPEMVEQLPAIMLQAMEHPVLANKLGTKVNLLKSYKPVLPAQGPTLPCCW